MAFSAFGRRFTFTPTGQMVVKPLSQVFAANTSTTPGFTPPTPPAPPPAPAAPAGPAPLPPDPNFEAQMAALTRQRDTTLSGLGTQRTTNLLDFGFKPQTDAGGNVTGLSFDPSNPFSRAALLRRNFQQARTGQTNSMAARGQLYAGAFQQAQDDTNRKEQQAQNALQTALLRFLAQNTQEAANARSAFDVGAAQAAANRVTAAPASPLYDPAPSAPDAPVDTPAAPAQAAAAPAAGVHGALVQSIPNYKSPTGRIGTMHIYADGTRVFVVK